MQPNPADRPASARQMAEHLEAFVRRPRHLLQAAGVTLLLLLASLAWWWRPGTTPTSGGGEPSLEVQVWRGSQSFRLLDALPLRSGDELQVFGQVPPGFQPSLFWFDTEGHLQELPLDASTDAAGIHFRYPPRAKAVELTGPPGTELLLMCARQSGTVAVEEIRTVFADRPWPSLPVHTLLMLDRRQVQLRGSRGPGPLTNRPESGILEKAEAVRGQLANRLDLAVAVAFPHQP